MSSEGTVVIDGVNYGQRLPRGRRIPPELVSANQRGRLFSAVAAGITERGYAALTVGAVIDRAHVSRSTFYRLFDGKSDCVLAAQRWAFERLRTTMVEACAGEPDWPRGVAAAVGAALDFASHSPGEARLVLTSSHSPSEPELACEEMAAHRQLAALLRDGSERWPKARKPDGVEERAAVGAAMSIVGSSLGVAGHDHEALAEVKANLIQIVLTPYLGCLEAERVATAV